MTAAPEITSRGPGAGLAREIVRGLVTGLLIAMLVVTGQMVAAAKGTAQRDMAGSLCLSGSVVTFAIGDDGLPEGPAHVCPDALLAAIDPPAAALPAAHCQLLHGTGPATACAQTAPGPSPEDPPPARAPPVPV